VGNEEYAKANESFGLTTLRNEHARVFGRRPRRVRLEFVGKSKKRHHVEIDDARLAAIVRRCLDIPGQELFQYLDPRGRRGFVRSNDVNGYIRALAEADFTAKDFRTWAATVHAAELLRARCADVRHARGHGRTKKTIRAAIAETIAEVAESLRNTPAVCKKSYVHPAVLEAFTDGWLADVTAGRAHGASAHDLSEPERFTLAVLRTALRREREKPSLVRALERSAERTPRKRAA
jgi:DNA topoisomerase-1